MVAGGQITFTLTPQQEGTLDILGFTYYLSGVIRGRQQFRSDAATAGAGGGDVDPALSLIVTAPMPRLVVRSLAPSKLVMLAGETVQATVVLANAGAAPLTHLRVALQHPHYLAFGQPGEDGASGDGAHGTVLPGQRHPALATRPNTGAQEAHESMKRSSRRAG